MKELWQDRVRGWLSSSHGALSRIEHDGGLEFWLGTVRAGKERGQGGFCGVEGWRGDGRERRLLLMQKGGVFDFKGALGFARWGAESACVLNDMFAIRMLWRISRYLHDQCCVDEYRCMCNTLAGIL